MKLPYISSFLLLSILFSACSKVQNSTPPVYQTISYHIYSKTSIDRQYQYPDIYDTIIQDYNIEIKICADSLIWTNGDLFYRRTSNTQIVYGHSLGYPFSIWFSDDRKNLEYRFDNGRNTRYSQTISLWGNKL